MSFLSKLGLRNWFKKTKQPAATRTHLNKQLSIESLETRITPALSTLPGHGGGELQGAQPHRNHVSADRRPARMGHKAGKARHHSQNTAHPARRRHAVRLGRKEQPLRQKQKREAAHQPRHQVRIHHLEKQKANQ